jgi:hypothetical protein
MVSCHGKRQGCKIGTVSFILNPIWMFNRGDLRHSHRYHFFMTPIIPWLDCAQIVPVKVKYFQMIPCVLRIHLDFSR